MDIDKAWCNNVPSGVNVAPGIAFESCCYGANTPVPDADIGRYAGCARTIDNRTVFDQQVERHPFSP
jgi:hypothetical protein